MNRLPSGAWGHGFFQTDAIQRRLRRALPIDDWRGREDATGRELMATQIAIADEAAAAADLVRDKAAAVPAVVVGGLGRWVTEEDGPGAAAIRRPREDDLFR